MEFRPYTLCAVTILGVVYHIEMSDDEHDKALCSLDGYCDTSIHKIVVREIRHERDEFSKADLESYLAKICRHEVIHAALYESGLCNNTHSCNCWADDEEMVDWIAIQIPKLVSEFSIIDTALEKSKSRIAFN